MAKRTKAQRARLSAALKAAHARRRLATGQLQLPAPTIAPDTFVVEGYEPLARELTEAYSQSAHGKGKARHANGKPFDRQPIMELGRLYGPGFAAGQAAKKAQEALGMVSRGEREKAVFEMHGAIVYLAAAAALIKEPA